MAKKKKWHPSDDIISFIKEKEGFLPRSTRPKGDANWTVGYGFTDKDVVDKYMDTDITKEEADAILAEMVNRRLPVFERSTPNFDKLNNNQRDALFSYFYNIGEGNYRNESPGLQAALEDLNHERIMEQIDAGYNQPGQAGLRRRRDEERAFYGAPNTIPYKQVDEYEYPLQDPKRYTNVALMASGGSVEDIDIKELYKEDVNRVINGEQPIYFSNLQDLPLNNVYPEFDVLSMKLPSTSGSKIKKTGFSFENTIEDVNSAIGEYIKKGVRTVDGKLPEKVRPYYRFVTDGIYKLFGSRPDKGVGFLAPDEEEEMAFGGTTQSEAQDYVYNKLVDEFNFTPVQAVGVVANLTYESGLNPTVVRKGGKDFGLQQWVGERRKNLYAYAKRKGHDIPTFDDQLEYVVKEYRGEENNGWTHINKGSNLYKKDPEKFKDFDYYQYSKAEFDNSNSISDAVVSWNQGFGRPPKEFLATDRRIKIGKDLATRYGIQDNGEVRYAEGSVGSANVLPEVEVVQARPETQQASTQAIGPAPSSYSYGTRPELQTDMEKWMNDYGKDLAAQLLNTNTLLNKTADLLDRNKDQEDLDNEKTKEQIKQAEQDQQLRSFIKELIPSMQVTYKGVAKSNS